MDNNHLLKGLGQRNPSARADVDLIGARPAPFLNVTVIPKEGAIAACLSVVFYVYFIGFFTYNFGFSVSAYYFTDALLIACLPMLVGRLGKTAFGGRLKWFSIILVAIVTTGTLSAVVNGLHPLLWLWSARNWGRFFVFFYLCVALLNREWIDKILSFTVGLFLVNAAVIVVQYFAVPGMSQDALNGLVGRDTSGVNIVLTLAASIIVSAEYAHGRCGLFKVAAVLVAVLVVSVLAELKATIFFAVAAFALVYATGRSVSVESIAKLLAFFMVAAIAIVVGVGVLNSLYPTSGMDLSLEGLMAGVSSEGGYGNSGRLDRLTAVDVVNRELFKGDVFRQLFGVGMGNAEYSAVEWLQSNFYAEYGAAYAYLNFSVSMLYIEGGYVGLALYAALFVVIIASTGRAAFSYARLSDERGFGRYEAIGLAMALIGLLFIWYNNLLRTDMSVLLAFYMAVPFALSRGGGAYSRPYDKSAALGPLAKPRRN